MKVLQPEIVVEVKQEKEEIEQPAPPKNRHDRRDKKKFAKIEEEPEEVLEPSEPELTAMELAWQAAKDKANHKRQTEIKAKKTRSVNDEQEDILSRTLGNSK
jgi:chromatin segregation and condensation protein Rec8/ScpA/Scc1 (kleisin family)